MRHLLITAALLAAAACAPVVEPPAAAIPAPPQVAAVPAPAPPVALVAAPAAPPVAAVAPAPPPVVVGPAPPPPLFSLELPVPNLVPAFLAAPAPGRLTLNNFSFDRVRVEAVVTVSEVCNVRVAGDAESLFDLPLNGTRIITAPPGSDVCWRRQVEPAAGQTGGASGWSDWSRAYIARGTAVNARL